MVRRRRTQSHAAPSGSSTRRSIGRHETMRNRRDLDPADPRIFLPTRRAADLRTTHPGAISAQPSIRCEAENRLRARSAAHPGRPRSLPVAPRSGADFVAKTAFAHDPIERWTGQTGKPHLGLVDAFRDVFPRLDGVF